MAAALLAGGPAMIITSDEGDFRALLDSAHLIPALRSSAARVAIVPV